MKKLKTIGKYDVIRTLGVGGMGTVYQCIDPDLQRFTAIKVLNMKGQKANAYALKMRFLREALTTAQLQHPSIPPVYEVGKDENGQIFYVMKPIEGRPLSVILESLRSGDPKAKEEFDLFRLTQILCDICQAIQYAHNKGYIHRDLKPSNIFVGNYGEVYVIDWGLTKIIKECINQEKISKLRDMREKFDIAPDININTPDVTQTVLIEDVMRTKTYGWEEEGGAATDLLEDALATREISLNELSVTRTLLLEDALLTKKEEKDLARTLTMQGKIMGTLSYMPPEQALGDIEGLGREADIYSLGVILYEMLTLELPINSTNLKEAVELKLKGEILLPEFKAPERNIPPELSNIAMQAMNPIPEERFRNAREFNNSLEYWLEGKSRFRRANKPSLNQKDFKTIPKSAELAWEISSDHIATRENKQDENAYLIFKDDFIGDVLFSADFIAYPEDEDERDGKINEFSIVMNATTPKPWKGYMDGYTVHLGADNNTRAYISRHGVEALSNEYLTIEPRKRYQLEVEHSGSNIKVSLNRQIVLLYKESSPLIGAQFGFLHCGKNIIFSDIKIRTRGLPNKVSALDVPEALMTEDCFEGAMKRFIAISQGHKNRFLGAWALYRAGVASYLMNRKRSDAMSIWKPMKKGPYSIFEKLGRASIEIENKSPAKAIKIIDSIISDGLPVPNLEPVADIVFAQTQQSLRHKPKTEKEWNIIDGWARLALKFGERLPDKQGMTVSILWRWLLLALIEYPKNLSGCIKFLREVFGEGHGDFAETLTAIEPLMTILKRSSKMSGHAFLMGKVMRLILNYDDNLGNLETLARFYLNSGHVDAAEKISEHIYALCKKHECEIPPFPIAFLACKAWITQDDRASELIGAMINYSTEWGVPDGRLMLGLNLYSLGQKDEAHACWRELVSNKNAISYNRHLVAKGLLGELCPDPVEAGVPNRSDHRLLYCLFVGYRHCIDWEFSMDEKCRQVAEQLLKQAVKLIRPSYDVYSASDIFFRVPLEKMGASMLSKTKPEPLAKAESAWLKELAMAASASKPEEFSKTTSIRKLSSVSASIGKA